MLFKNCYDVYLGVDEVQQLDAADLSLVHRIKCPGVPKMKLPLASGPQAGRVMSMDPFSSLRPVLPLTPSLLLCFGGLFLFQAFLF